MLSARPLALLALALVVPSRAASLPPRDAFVWDEQVNSTLQKRSASYYTALVAFGASYTDNAHPRAAAYAGTLRMYYPYAAAGGRYSNGPVAVEYMVQNIGTSLPRGNNAVNLIDYAYGGSQVDNSLTSGSAPAAKDQIAQYLSDLSSNAISAGDGRVLHYYNSGINPLQQIWTAAVNAGLSGDALNTAYSAVNAEAAAVASQLRGLHSNGAVTSINTADFVLVGIPPLETVPTFQYQTSSSYALSILQDLTQSYNSQLKSFASSFKNEVAASTGGKVTFFDLASLWKSFYYSPQSFGITASVTSTCYNSATGSVCSNPGSYLYFDTLHPVTSIHYLIAVRINQAVLQS